MKAMTTEIALPLPPSPNKSHPKFTMGQMLKAVHLAKGMVSHAARRLRCHPETIREYANRFPEIAQALQEEREAVTDIAELALHKAIQERQGWAVCFYLKTQGRSRGYIERIEHTGEGGGPITVDVIYTEDWRGHSVDNGVNPPRIKP